VVGQILVSDPSIPTNISGVNTNSYVAKHIPSLLQAPGLTIYFERPTAEMRQHFNSYAARFFFYPMRLLWSSNSTLGRCETENAAPEYDCFCGLHYLHLGPSNN
jgi:hypothetical protein